MLVSEWSNDGCVVWCDVKPNIKEQLNTVLNDPIYCNNDQLKTLLSSKYNYFLAHTSQHKV